MLIPLPEAQAEENEESREKRTNKDASHSQIVPFGQPSEGDASRPTWAAGRGASRAPPCEDCAGSACRVGGARPPDVGKLPDLVICRVRRGTVGPPVTTPHRTLEALPRWIDEPGSVRSRRRRRRPPGLWWAAGRAAADRTLLGGDDSARGAPCPGSRDWSAPVDPGGPRRQKPTQVSGQAGSRRALLAGTITGALYPGPGSSPDLLAGRTRVALVVDVWV
jgi:hypothetical protein